MATTIATVASINPFPNDVRLAFQSCIQDPDYTNRERLPYEPVQTYWASTKKYNQQRLRQEFELDRLAQRPTWPIRSDYPNASDLLDISQFHAID
jgi:hypothetical protein